MSFDDYFRIQQQITQTTPNEDFVTDNEIGQYMNLVFGNTLRADKFNVQTEGQINAGFLHPLAREFESRGRGRLAGL